MNLFIRKKAYILMDRYNVLDDTGRVIYSVDGKLVRHFGKLEMRDRAGIEILEIAKGSSPFFSSYTICEHGKARAQLRQNFKLLPDFSLQLDGQDFSVAGNLHACDFEILAGEASAARIRKRNLRWGDTYILSIQNLEYAPVLSAMTVCLDNALFHNFL